MSTHYGEFAIADPNQTKNFPTQGIGGKKKGFIIY
jgi:hypothetical protein